MIMTTHTQLESQPAARCGDWLDVIYLGSCGVQLTEGILHLRLQPLWDKLEQLSQVPDPYAQKRPP